MIKLNILIVSPHEEQSSKWSARLEKSGYNVMAVQPDLSGMVFTLSREKIHIVMCAAELIRDNAHAVLNGAMEFFPRIKIVVIGDVLLPHALPKLTNVVFMKSFDPHPRELFGFPGNEPHYGDRDDVLRLLLSEHFLTFNRCAVMLKSIGHDWTPEFVVISVVTDSNASFITRILGELAKKLSLCAVLKMSSNEICAMLEKSPTMPRCLEVADTIRSHLLQRTDSNFSIGVSRSRVRADELFACRKEALRAAEASHLYGRDGVTHINFLDDNDIWYVYPHHKERRLIECTLDGDSAGALRLLDELFSFLSDRDNLSQRYINKVAMRIWVEMNLAASSRVTAFETAQTDSMSYGRLLVSKSREEVYSFLKDGVVSLAGEMSEIADVRRDVLFMKLSALKDAGGKITLSDLTKEFHTTISFLNDAVCRNSGKNIFDFFSGE